jgi:paraquat-inducible protein A
MSGVPNAARLALSSCHDCHLVVRTPAHHHAGRCPRCGAKVHVRKSNSIARTWALMVTAAILYIPANVFPVMTVTSLGQAQSDTIVSGVIHLFDHGMWPLALLVFFASVVVPLLKLVSLTILLVTVQRGSTWRPVLRTRMYRVTESVGRWSMVDIYVVTILVALVKLGALASIEAGPGAVFFGAVVVTTMIAAETFDPRLIWDNLGVRNE